MYSARRFVEWYNGLPASSDVSLNVLDETRPLITVFVLNISQKSYFSPVHLLVLYELIL